MPYLFTDTRTQAVQIRVSIRDTLVQFRIEKYCEAHVSEINKMSTLLYFKPYSYNKENQRKWLLYGDFKQVSKIHWKYLP